MRQVETIDDATFAEAVERDAGLSVVDFGAAWCPPCRIVEPILESLSVEYRSRIRVLRMDADENPATAARFGIRSLPTVLFFRDGAVVERIVGAVPRAEFQRSFDALLSG